MADREKVIRGLECVLDAMVQSEHAIAENGVVMSSWQDRAKRIDAIRDAIALLKAQEPRVMTLEELDGLQEDDAIFVEIKPLRDWTCVLVELVRFVEKAQDPDTWIELHTTDSAGLYMTRKTTDPNWRCWTSRPTEEQREETPWN